MLLEEREHVAALAAHKALVALLGWAYEERGVPVVVERTDALVVHACLPERQELSDDIHDVRRVVDFVNHFL